MMVKEAWEGCVGNIMINEVVGDKGIEGRGERKGEVR